MDTLSALQEKYKVLVPQSQRSKRYSITELKNDMGRRPSISSNSGSRRPSNAPTPGKRFQSIGSKVTNMLKVKMAFQKKDGAQKEDNSPFIKITELPKEPRFCSTLSPEAQFAMMKGYEDTVYAYISSSYPEYKFLLRRSRTPKSIPKCSDETLDYRSFPSGNKESADYDGFGEEDETDGAHRSSGIKVQRSLTNSPLSSTSRKNRLKSSTYDNRLNNTIGLSRSNSLPVLVPRERQLITTYRLQSIMDILDTVRSKMGQQALSPRIKSYPGEIKPVTDFNKWTTVWSKEFLDKQITGK